MKVISTDTAEHYKWGADCDGWHLLKDDALSIIEEFIPSGEMEQRHYHHHAQQFFYVLSGTASIEISGNEYEISPGCGIHVPAMEPHQLCNKGNDSLRFLVISQPQSHGDRAQAF